MEEIKSIAIIDLDSVAYAIFNPNKVLDENGVPKRTDDNKRFIYSDKSEEEIMVSANTIMNDIFISSGCSHYIGLIKGNDTITSKLAINSDYKQNRSKEVPKWWNFTKDYLIKEYRAVEVNGLETDDACNIIRLALKDSFICCIDSDLLGLEGTHFNWRKKEWITTTKEQAEYNFWSSMICGTHNNTKGIPGKGKKFVESLFSKYEQYGEPKLNIVLSEYVNHFSEYKGIEEFYKNYICLKILEEKESFVIPEPNKVFFKE